MEKLTFRLLEASEIDCRIATVSEKGVSLLLYKDARVDQNILDETVGPMNWQRSHSRDNANCMVSLWDDEKKQWISKEDTGTESYTEKEKGLASELQNLFFRISLYSPAAPQKCGGVLHSVTR